MKHVMLDIETLGVKHNPVILSIGAVKFDGDKILEAFHVGIDPEDAQERFGCRIEAGAVMWWMSPEKAAAREAMLALAKVDFTSAIFGFVDWVNLTPSEELGSIWGNGATFDLVHMRHAVELVGVSGYPFTHKQEECYRTLKNRCPDVPFVKPATAHDALGDATAQAVHTQAICRQLGIAL